jgi:hypothetical protein
MPLKLTPELIEAICADIRRGCYLTVAAGRNGISNYTDYKWRERGRREFNEREELEPRPEPSLYEQYYLATEQAKSEARYWAETKVYEANPEYWLGRGYARNDWRPVAVDHVETTAQEETRRATETTAADVQAAMRDPVRLADLVKLAKEFDAATEGDASLLRHAARNVVEAEQRLFQTDPEAWLRYQQEQGAGEDSR